MLRRSLLSKLVLVPAVPATLAAAAAVPDALAVERRRPRPAWRTGLLLEGIEGEADHDGWGHRRRDGEFAGDILVTALHFGRALHAKGIVDGEVSLGRRRELDVDLERFRRVGLALDAGRRGLKLDLGEIELKWVSIDPDAVSLDRIYGPHGQHLFRLLEALAEALEDADDHRRKARPDGEDIRELVEAINRLLGRFLHVVKA